MAIQPTQPQGVGGVLDTSFQLYKASIATVWPLCLLMSIVSSPPSLYLMIGGGGQTGAAGMLSAMSNPVYWLVYVVSMTLMLWTIGALYLKEYSIGIGAEQSAGSALQAALVRLVPLLLAVVLMIVAITVGLVLLLIPGFILMVSLMLGTNLVLFEGKGPIEALSGSHKLVWGNWWRVAAILTVGFILLMVIYAAVGLIIGVLAPLIGFGVDDIVTYSAISGLLVGVIVNVLVTPYYAALLIALYWDLKLRKEGGDLAARVGALNAV